VELASPAQTLREPYVFLQEAVAALARKRSHNLLLGANVLTTVNVSRVCVLKMVIALSQICTQDLAANGVFNVSLDGAMAGLVLRMLPQV